MSAMKAAHRVGTQRACYFPLSTPGTMGDSLNSHRPFQYDPFNLPMRTHEEYLEPVHAYIRSKSSIRAQTKRSTGIEGQSIFHDFDAPHMPFFFPVDVFHVTRLDVP